MLNKVFCLGYIFIALPFVLSAQELTIGTTTALWQNPTAANMEQAKENGFEYVEVAINQFYRNVPPEEVKPRIYKFKESIDSAVVKVWSVHLPFSKTLDISVLDDSLRQKSVEFMAGIIELCAIFKPQKLVLHPSSEPIEDNQREQRIINTIQSIDYLRTYADKIGVQLCIENLPRTCLGNTPDELLRIVSDFPEVGICFDTNHYLTGSPFEFIEKAGSRIVTVHVSDYDGINECHWIPGQGVIDWGKMLYDLKKSGYKGVFMFETTKDHELNQRATSERLIESYSLIKEQYTNYQKESNLKK